MGTIRAIIGVSLRASAIVSPFPILGSMCASMAVLAKCALALNQCSQPGQLRGESDENSVHFTSPCIFSSLMKLSIVAVSMFR